MTMRLLCPSSSVSPFCTCKSHSLPTASPELERIWQSIPGEVQKNSLLEFIDEDSTATLFVPHLSRLSRIAPPPLKLHPFLPPYTPQAPTYYVRDIGKPIDDISASDTSSTSDFSILTPPPSYSTLDYLDEPDSVRAAHFVYDHVFAGDESPLAMFTRVDELMRLASTVNISVLRSTLRKITMLSFNEMWKSRSELWYHIENTSHRHAYMWPASYVENYGIPARRLASFAGVLFAHEILNVSDLRSCIDKLRSRLSQVALQALHDLVAYAGDKSCKSKNREYMEDLRAEQAKRVRMPHLAFDHGAQILISEICRIITGYFVVQTGKREKGAKALAKSRRQKIVIKSWSINPLSI